jgi:hypothetical protein
VHCFFFGPAGNISLAYLKKKKLNFLKFSPIINFISKGGKNNNNKKYGKMNVLWEWNAGDWNFQFILPKGGERV